MTLESIKKWFLFLCVALLCYVSVALAYAKKTKGILARFSAFEKKLPEGDREERLAKIRQELKGPRGKNHD